MHDHMQTFKDLCIFRKVIILCRGETFFARAERRLLLIKYWKSVLRILVCVWNKH